MTRFVTINPQNQFKKPTKKKQADRFKITKVEGKSKDSWLVTGYSLDGKRIRKRCDTEKQAEAFQHFASLRQADTGLNNVVTRLNKSQVEDAEACYKMLDGDSLLEAVKFYKDNYKKVSGEPIRDAVHRYVEMKELKKLSPRTIQQAKHVGNAFSDSVGNKPIDEVLEQDILAYIDGRSDQTFNNYRTVLSGLFTWAVKQNLCSSNPVDGIERVRIRQNIEYLKPAEVEDLMFAAMRELDGELLAFASLAIFLGLRPDSEAVAITWDCINFEDLEVQVPHGKLGVKRTVAMSQNLVEFLSVCDRSKPIYPNNWRSKWAMVRRAAGFKGGYASTKDSKKLEANPKLKPWISDGLRHSYCTYLARTSGDVYKTATAAGNSKGIIKGHYEGAATTSEAKRFWAITPRTLSESKVVRFG